MLDYKRREALDHVIVEKENYRSMLQYAKQLGIQTRLQSHKVDAAKLPPFTPLLVCT